LPPAPLPADADEDAAEAHRAPDENYAVIHAEAPALASAAVAPQPTLAKPAPAVPVAKPMPAPKPAAPAAAPKAAPPLVATAKPAAKPLQVASAAPVKPVPQPAPAKPALTVASVAKPMPAAKPQQPAPALRPQIVADQAPAADHNWTIQIGAFGNQTLAQAQLTSFVAKAKDIIGAGAPIVAPIQSANGHTLYRARFGPYAEREARNVCSQLTQRGEPCFPVVSR
jgi:D-alanyl-D-alanine carboxypeptidase